MIQKLIKKYSNQARQLFVIDGIGALISCFLLGIVLVYFNEWIGLSIPTLYFLAFFPLLFAIYDWYAYQQESKPNYYFLKRIAIANILYCCVSLIICFLHFESLTIFGWSYFILEIIIVLILAYVELRVSNK